MKNWLLTLWNFKPNSYKKNEVNKMVKIEMFPLIWAIYDKIYGRDYKFLVTFNHNSWFLLVAQHTVSAYCVALQHKRSITTETKQHRYFFQAFNGCWHLCLASVCFLCSTENVDHHIYVQRTHLFGRSNCIFRTWHRLNATLYG